MRDRIAEASEIDASYLWISTFHSACLRIFRKDFQKLGYAYMPVVFDETDQKSLVKSIIKQMGETDSELPAGKVLSLGFGNAQLVEGVLDVLGNLVPASALPLRSAHEVVDVLEVDVVHSACGPFRHGVLAKMVERL